jgi:DNA polymerase I-like protein with 3'-5' exonuclease and polymerase domains
MTISIDTETTGVDLFHASRPFFVTICGQDGEQQFFEWDVNPLTREVEVVEDDLGEIGELLSPNNTGEIVGQNIKFDVTALSRMRPEFGDYWRWEDTHDTLIAGHLLHSSMPHDLTSLALHYLGVDIQPYEDRLEEAVKACRRIVQQAKLKVKRGKEEGEFAHWMIAGKDVEGMPSAKEEAWKNDTWLPRAMVRQLWESSECCRLWSGPWDPTGEVCPSLSSGKILDTLSATPGWEYRPPEIANGDHPWWTLLRDYANADSGVTLALWGVMREELCRRGLWEIYLERMKVPPVIFAMEKRGVTVSEAQLESLTTEYREESKKAERLCVNLAAGYMVSCECRGMEPSCGYCSGTRRVPYRLELPRNGINASLRTFCFDVLRLPPIYSKKAKTANPTLDKSAMEEYEATLPEKSKALAFVRALRGKRKRDTSIAYMEGYKRFWQPLNYWESNGVAGPVDEWFVLHPHLNQTGTDTLRMSSQNPNSQNISKLPDEQGYTLRACFAPAPGREWWSLDAKNIELRIPAYEAGEEEFIKLFERPDDPPYYGSNHLLIFHLLWPDLWNAALKEVGIEKVGPYCKKKYASTQYQWTKNGNFAVTYGAVNRDDGQGTADRAYHQSGAQARIDSRFSKLTSLNQKWIRFAERHGYVETMPDKTVNPRKGYPVMCTRTEYGKIRPTVPLNYHVQSTAMWWMAKAMVRCHRQLEDWREKGFDGYLVAQIHDELVFDFPKGGDPIAEAERGKSRNGKALVRTSNLWRIREIKRLMELGGDDIGVPTPVSCEYHEKSWAEGVPV